MKLPELKARLKNKYTVRIIAGVLVVALAGTSAGIGVYTVKADNNDTSSVVESADADADDFNVDKILDGVSVSTDKADKEESVYFISDASGNVEKTIVVDHLTNQKKDATIADESNLTDIENVKGDETFTQDGNKLTWQADGNDIYYHGNSTAEEPVSQKVTYLLDGKEMTPDEIAGKSGKVTIRFDYTNNTTYTETVNGTEYTVNVPFVAVTALALDDNFKNIEVTNGKLEEREGSNVILGYALPGLKDSLGVDEEKLNDAKIPEYFEVTADVENFSVKTAMTFVVNATSYVSTEGSLLSGDFDGVIDELSGAINQLTDGSGQLSDGANDLSDGAGQLDDGLKSLQSNLKTFGSGMKSLKTGLTSYLDGANQINTGLTTLKEGTGKLSKGVTDLDNGADQLAAGAKTLSDGAKTLKEGTGTAYAGSKTLTTGANTLKDGIKQYTEGVATANSGATTLAGGAKQVSDGVNTLAATVSSMPATILAGINANLDTINASGIVGAMNYAGFADQKITLANIESATNFLVSNSTTVIGVLTAKLGDATAAQTAYNKAVAGLYQVQGAASVYSAVNTSVAASTEDVTKLVNGAKHVSDGASQLSTGLSTLAGKNEALNSGATQVAAGAASLESGLKSISEGSSSLATGASSLETGANTLADGTQTLADSMPTLTSGIDTLAAGSDKLVANNKKIGDGIKKLANGTTAIIGGVDKLSDGSGKLLDGAGQLADGASKLADGIVEFDEKGIEKLINSYDGDIKPLADRLQVIMDAGSDYDTFSGLADGSKGSVKFIYKLASIEAAKDAE